jgi:hypothetical protein
LAARLRIREGGRDAKLIARPTYGTPEDIVGLKLTPDLLAIRTIPKTADRAGRDHEEIRELRQISVDVLGQTVAEVRFLRAGTKIFERNHRNSRTGRRRVLRCLFENEENSAHNQYRARDGSEHDPPFGHRCRPTHPAGTFRWPAPDLGRLRDVLQSMHAGVRKSCTQRARELLGHLPRDADAAGRREALEPRGHVHPITEYVAAIVHDVTEADADAKHHPPLVRERGVELAQSVLDFQRATSGFDTARKLCDDTVASRAEYPAAMRLDELVDDCSAFGQGGERRLLIEPHEPAVSDRVGGQYGG